MTTTAEPPVRYEPPSGELDPVTAYAAGVRDGSIVAGRAVRLAAERHFRNLAAQSTPAFPYHFDVTAAERVIEFFPTFLTLENGQPFVLPPWLQFSYGSIFGWKRDADGYRRIQHGFFETSKGSGKALALDTPIATPAGWSTMGDLQIGDQVYDERGRPTNVVAVSNVMVDHQCFEVEFDDGTVIVADAEHLWFTEMRSACRADGKIASAGVPLKDRGRWKRAVRTTAEIARTLRYSNGRYRSANHSIPLAAPLNGPSQVLPIPPYVLGVWLGDGDSDCGRLTVDDADAELLEYVASCGVAVGERKQSASSPRTPRYRLVDATAALRRADLLHNKHIPGIYLRASVEQRLELLQGLMDTDGYIAPRTGECTFTTTTRALAVGIRELIVSLGMKCSLREGTSTLYGRTVSACWEVQFHPPHDLPVFRLRRKVQWQRQRHARRRLSGDRRIVDVRPVPSVPVRCIGVDSPSHLFLAGATMVPTHNTPSAGGVAIYGSAYDDEPYAEIYTTGFDKDQAGIILRDAIRMVENSPEWEFKQEFDVGKNNIAHLLSGSFIRALSSEVRSKSGPRPHYVLSDEIHEHRDGTVVDKAEAGFKNRPQPLGLKYTNSGADQTSYCWELHQKSLAVLEGTLVDEQWFAYVCHLDPCPKCYDEGYRQPKDGCKNCDNWQDPAVWPKIAPALGIVIQPKYLQDRINVAISTPSTFAMIRRLNFCIWTQTHQVWISPERWDACKQPEPETPREASACAAAFDMSEKIDLTSCVVGLKIDDAPGAEEDELSIVDMEGEKEVTKTLKLNYSVDLYSFFWLPEETLLERVKKERLPYDAYERAGFLRKTPGPIIDHDLIYEQFTGEIYPRFKPTLMGYDPHNARQFGLALRDKAKYGNERVLEVPGGRPLSEAFKWFEALVRARRIRHWGNPVMGMCVANCEAKYDRYRNLWVERPAGGVKRIDGAIAAVMMLQLLMKSPTRKEFQAMVFGPKTGGKR